jgi:hypothetical protein
LQREVHFCEATAGEIHLDANHWNARWDQGIQSEATKPAKARLRYLSKFVEIVAINTPCLKENPELLAAEMLASKGHVPAINPILSSSDTEKVLPEVKRVADGELEEKADVAVLLRTQIPGTSCPGPPR